MGKNEFLGEVKKRIKPTEGEIIQFLEDKKEFGNITLVISVNGTKYKYETDRGEILLNGNTVFPVFHDFGLYLTKYEKILLAIKNTLHL